MHLQIEPPAPVLSRRVSNRLVLVPQIVDERLGLVRKEHLASLALQLGEGGDSYIYVAMCGQKDAEDNEMGVRFLPLDRDRLPCFGDVESVVVLNDKAMAAAAASAYPTAAVFHLEPVAQAQTLTRIEPLVLAELEESTDEIAMLAA